MTPLPPPPRAVRHTQPLARAFASTCLITLVVLSLALGLALANELAYRFLGHDVSAAVTSLHERPDGDGNYKRVAHFTYSPGPGHPPRADSARIEHGAFRELQKPFMIDTIPDDVTFPPDRPGVLVVRAYTVGPFVYGRPVLHEHGLFFLLIPSLFFPLLLLITFVVYRGVVIRERKRRWLFVHGLAVAGTITARRQEQSEETHFDLADYEFSPPGHDGLFAGTMWLRTTAAYDASVPGAAVTILYDPADPAQSTVYEFGRYRVMTAGG